jgi:hypothetical protein
MHSPSFSALAISLGILTLGLPAAPAQGEPAAPTAPHRARFTVDTPIADLMANPGARLMARSRLSNTLMEGSS